MSRRGCPAVASFTIFTVWVSFVNSPVLKRKISHGYDVITMPVLG